MMLLKIIQNKIYYFLFNHAWIFEMDIVTLVQGFYSGNDYQRKMNKKSIKFYCLVVISAHVH